MRRIVSLLALSGLASCGAYTSEARQSQISGELDGVNGKSYDATLARLLAKRRATLMTSKAETFGVRLEECAGQPVRLERKDGHAAIALDCNALRDAFVGGRAIDAKDEANHDVLVVPAEGAYGGGPFLLAPSGDGKLLVIDARRHKVDSRVIRVPGNCDRMPRVQTMLPFVNVFILEGHSASEVEHVVMDFDTVEIDRKCDTYTD